MTLMSMSPRPALGRVPTSSSSTANVYAPETVRWRLARKASSYVVLVTPETLRELPNYQSTDPTSPRPGFRFVRWYLRDVPCADGMCVEADLWLCTIALDPDDHSAIYWLWSRCAVIDRGRSWNAQRYRTPNWT